jgi:curved DNA-binding protein
VYFPPPPDWGAGFEFSGPGAGNADYSDFFESLFGAQARSRSRSHAAYAGRGEDHHAKVLLDLDATLRGGARQLSLRVPEIDADGRLVSKERVLNVQVPKGILAGQHIRLAGQGARPAGDGTAGDLYIEVEFQPHPLYRLDGRDLYLDLPVAPWEAALGATVKTPTPTGTVDLKIPAASHAGSKLRLKGRGIPAAPAGDFYVILQIALPVARDDKAKAAYAAMAAALPFNPRANLGV